MKNNYRRELITEFNLLDCLEMVGISERNKEIVRAYASGSTAAALARQYQISQTRVAQILDDFIWKCLEVD